MNRLMGCLWRKRISGEHYFKIKVLHQHVLTFLTCVPASAAKVSANLWEKSGFTGAFNAFCGSLRIDWKAEGALCWAAYLIWNKTQRSWIHRGDLAAGCLVLLVCFFVLFVLRAAIMVKTTSFELARTPAWHNPAPFKSLHLPKQIQMCGFFFFFGRRISHLDIDF